MAMATALKESDEEMNRSRARLSASAEEIDFDEIDEDLERFQEDEMVQQALHKGIHLRDYADHLEDQLKEVERESVAQYVENSSKVLELHKQMQNCDNVLARMQEMLLGFQADLGGISEEIKHLQDQSLSMNVKLRNRRAAEERLNKFLEQVTMPAEVGRAVAGEITDEFVEVVTGLTLKIKYLSQVEPATDGSSLDLAPRDTMTGQTLLPDLEKLRTRAVVKIRDYFSQQFDALRRPKTNVQMIQQTSLLKYRGLMTFLREASPEAFEELRTMYIETMSRTLFNLFKAYQTQLNKLDMPIGSRAETIAVEDTSMRGMFSNKGTTGRRTDAFCLSDRERILEDVEAEPILVHVAQALGQHFTFEAIVRSILKHLCDSATSEFLFVLDFFQEKVTDTFNRMFARTLSLVLEGIENYLLQCFDCIGLLLLIRVTHLHRHVMQRRRVPVLDSFFDRISILLWPKFKHLLDMNLRSVRVANPRKLGPVDTTPHYITRRYAEFVASVLTLHGGGESMGISGGGEDMLLNDLAILRSEVIGLLERLGELLQSPRDKCVFMISNFDQMLTVLRERRVISDEVNKFDDLLMRQRELFVEEELKGTFGRLVSFVTQTEQAFADTSSRAVSLDEGIVAGLAREFANGWRGGIQQIHDDVQTYFGAIRNNTEILKQVLTQLLLYYTRFQELIKRAWPRPPAFTRDIVSTATILSEIKRFSRNA